MTTWVEINGKTHRVSIDPDGSVTVDGAPVAVDACTTEPGVLSLLLDGRSYRCLAEDLGDGPAVRVNGQRFAYTLADPRSLTGRQGRNGAAEGGAKTLKAPMPGRVVRLLVSVGDTVESGQGCVVIEAMKMQNELKAPKSGTVARLSVKVDDVVAANAVILVIE